MAWLKGWAGSFSFQRQQQNRPLGILVVVGLTLELRLSFFCCSQGAARNKSQAIQTERQKARKTEKQGGGEALCDTNGSGGAVTCAKELLYVALKKIMRSSSVSWRSPP